MLFPKNNELFRETFHAMGLRARVTDRDGTVTRVQFYNGSTLLGEGSRLNGTDEYVFSTGPIGKGNHSLYVVASDNTGASRESWPAHISVAPNAPRYALVELETRATDHWEDVGGINNAGEIVGFFDDPGGRWGYVHSNFKTERIPPMGAVYVVPHAIDDNGRVTGELDFKLFIFTPGKGTELLSPSHSGKPYGISRAGVVGAVSANDIQPFYWDGHTMQVLQNLGGWRGEARAINDHGTAVGWSYTFQTKNPRAFTFKDGVMKEMPDDATDPTIVPAGAFAINNREQIAGVAGDKVFLFSEGGYKRLGVLGADHSPNDINDQGVVVGQYSHEFQETGFIYHDGVMINLNQLIPAAGYHIKKAVGINNQGQIAAVVKRPGKEYPQYSALLSPVPVQRAYRSLNAVVQTTYPLPGRTVLLESEDLINWTPVLTNNLGWVQFSTSEDVSILHPKRFRRIYQP